ncbi:MAG: DUF5666 domain-containing protein [Pseudomonadota bacterium]|nr:DUF5666 domain-containing protein [Pseudomonadota bacterium]
MPAPLRRRHLLAATAASATALLLATPAHADDDKYIKGRITSINYDERSLIVGDHTIYVDQRTDYDDGLRHFGDLRVGQRVEVEYRRLRNGRLVAKEIELDN